MPHLTGSALAGTYLAMSTAKPLCTPEQNIFVNHYLATGSGVAAFRAAFPERVGNKSDSWVAARAATQLRDKAVIHAVNEARALLADHRSLTLDRVLDELEHARQVAMVQGNASAMVAATKAKAELAGLKPSTKVDATVTHHLEPSPHKLADLDDLIKQLEREAAPSRGIVGPGAGVIDVSA